MPNHEICYPKQLLGSQRFLPPLPNFATRLAAINCSAIASPVAITKNAVFTVGKNSVDRAAVTKAETGAKREKNFL